MFQVESVYRWEGAVERAKEWMLFCKIKAADYDKVEAAIRHAHSYVTPEIVAIEIEKGAQAYLAWLVAATRRS
jgi:periplasmic divalent cation tolerance protein